MKKRHTNIAVIESRWLDKSNISVRSLFDLIADIHCDNPHGYHYEMVNSPTAIREAIPRIGGLKHCKILSIAAHGDTNGLQFGSGKALSRTVLRNALNAVEGSRFTGLHLGSCSFGARGIADYLFEEGVKLNWVAGYREEVDWIESSALDLLFFNEMLTTRKNTSTPRKHVGKVASRVRELAGGLAEKLGFGLYVRTPRTGKAKDLLAKDV